MSKKRKLIEKVLSGSKNIRFDDFITLLGGFGFILDRVRGSHHIFSHPDIPDLLSIQPKKNGQAKPYQIREFIKFLDRYNLKLDED